MGKYELKTKLNDAKVEDFIKSVENDQRREDAFQLLDIFAEVTGEQPKMWGTSIVGMAATTTNTLLDKRVIGWRQASRHEKQA